MREGAEPGTRRYDRYLRAKLLRDAQYAFGPVAYLGEEHQLLRRSIETEAGSLGRAEAADMPAVTELKKLGEQLGAAEDVAYYQYSRPVDRAALLVMNTPAPDLAAVDAKIEMIKREDLHRMPDDRLLPFAIVEADIRRLGRGK